MITRLEGTADNYTLVFTQVGGSWQATVPADLTDSEYVVSLTAYDDAGNSSFFATLLLIVDTSGIHYKFIFSPYYAKLRKEEYTCRTLPNLYSVKIRPCG
jgi:hypothetical protein